jgi:DMSO/TMAO reductase YedYZ molybdopterin-dependent catalytic subunit
MSFITRGFSGRNRERDDRLPPGQTLVHDFPVLSAGPTPEIDTADWEFTIRTESGEHRWNWDEFMELKIDDVVMAHSYGGYTTNIPLDELLDGKAWVAFEFDGEPLDPEHGGPARLLVPHLYFWKSAKWVAGLRVIDHDEPGFWEQNGYHIRGDPWKEERYWSD